jgi:hypothetical protein
MFHRTVNTQNVSQTSSRPLYSKPKIRKRPHPSGHLKSIHQHAALSIFSAAVLKLTSLCAITKTFQKPYLDTPCPVDRWNNESKGLQRRKKQRMRAPPCCALPAPVDVLRCRR